MRIARTTRNSALIAGAIAALAVTPALAQEPPGGSGEESQVTCEPADPDPGGETTCTAEGLEPESVFDWTATFADDSEKTGTGAANEEGTGEFTVTVPEGEEAEGDYTVTVTGTAEDGSAYEESHEGTVGGGGFSPLAMLTEQPEEDPEEGDPEEEPSDEEGGDSAPPPGSDSGQVDPAPSGAVATGAGGTAADGGSNTAVVGILALAVLAIGVWYGQRINPTTDR